MPKQDDLRLHMKTRSAGAYFQKDMIVVSDRHDAPSVVSKVKVKVDPT